MVLISQKLCLLSSQLYNFLNDGCVLSHATRLVGFLHFKPSLGVVALSGNWEEVGIFHSHFQLSRLILFETFNKIFRNTRKFRFIKQHERCVFIKIFVKVDTKFRYPFLNVFNLKSFVLRKMEPTSLSINDRFFTYLANSGPRPLASSV